MKGAAGASITQASLSAISYEVNRISDSGTETETGTGTLTVSSVVFDTAQTPSDDPRIPTGQTANFIAVIPASCFPAAGRGLRHRITVTFDPASGEDFAQDWVVVLEG